MDVANNQVDSLIQFIAGSLNIYTEFASASQEAIVRLLMNMTRTLETYISIYPSQQMLQEAFESLDFAIEFAGKQN